MKDTQDRIILLKTEHNLVNIVLLVLYKKMTMLWIDKESVDIFITVITIEAVFPFVLKCRYIITVQLKPMC